MPPESSLRRSRPRTVDRQRVLQHRLLDAAEAMIATGGLPSIRARALASAVGCSVGAIYGAYPDLDALILVVNSRTLGAIDTRLAAAASPDAVRALMQLAQAYLDYAHDHRPRWNALFAHTMAEGGHAPDWYAAQQAAIFRHVEAPLAQLQPGLAADARALLARSLFSAVHGMVALGLDETVAAMPLPALHQQVAAIVGAIARGLPNHAG